MMDSMAEAYAWGMAYALQILTSFILRRSNISRTLWLFTTEGRFVLTKNLMNRTASPAAALHDNRGNGDNDVSTGLLLLLCSLLK